MTRNFDILVAGEINPDLILSGDVEPDFGQVEKLVDSAVLTIGSSSVIFSCGAARLGLKVAFVGKCGDDLFGHFMLGEMQNRGIDISHVITVPGRATGLSVILNRGIDRAILTHPGLMQDLQATDIPEDLLRQAHHIHVASYFLQTALQPELPSLFQRARNLGLTTSLDTNYDPSEQWHGFDQLLAVTNIFLPNESEACSLTRTVSVDQAAAQLSKKVETLAVKLGAQGALGVSRSTHPNRGEPNQTVRVASIPVKVIDTVGAGDSFDAGFIFGYLQGWSLDEALRAAAFCGAMSTRSAGGTSAQAVLSELMSFLG